jgi:myo-inositol 2-dehydrogenase/D-chiro-inositol 1-dehydrogenase
VVAVADVDEERGRHVAARASARAFASWEALLEHEGLDAVLVCTPPALHRGPCLAALERGIAVYVEKPIARGGEDGRAIVAAARASGAVCAVGYQYRAIDFLDDLRAIATASPLGLLAARSIGPTQARPWFVDPASGGGQLLERASHHVDLQRALAGEVAWVQASGARVPLAGDARPAGTDIDDVVSLTLGFRSGALGTVLVAWTDRALPSVYDLELVAAAARVRVELDPGFRADGVASGEAVRLVASEPPIRRGLRRFLAAVRDGDPGAVACTAEDAAGTLDVALACERAAETGAVARVGGA